MIILAYLQYGQWTFTNTFANEAKAREHCQRRLDNNEIRDKDTGDLLSADTNAHIEKVYMLDVEPTSGVRLK